jgi:hypothetical protein
MTLLFDGDADGWQPVGQSAEAVAPRGCVLIAVLLLVLASCAVMGGADRVETAGVAVGTHVVQLGHLLNGVATAVPVGFHILVVWLIDH